MLETTMTAGISSGITTAATDVVGLITSNLPIILGVVVAFVGLGFAVRRVRRIGR